MVIEDYYHFSYHVLYIIFYIKRLADIVVGFKFCRDECNIIGRGQNDRENNCPRWHLLDSAANPVSGLERNDL